MAVTIDGSETYFEKTTIDNMLFYNYPRVINIWSFSDEAVGIIEKFMEMHPDFGYDIKTTVIENTSSSYTAALDQALALGGANAPDIYFAEAVFVYKYTQGDASGFAASYEDLGIDVHTLAEEAEIAPYIFEIGTNKEGEVAALCYQSTGGAFIYRRSIAIDTWGTDDPDKIKDIVGPGWDKFLEAAADLKDKGYCIVSSSEDIWTVIENSAEKGWIADGRLYIDPQREAFLDISRQLEDNGYYNNTQKWGEDWFADMNETGENEVFGFFGPAWFVNFVLCQSAGDTFGDWAVCVPPTDYHWGGTWALANKDSKMKEAIAQIIEWITLDSSETGLQYMLATGTMDEDDGPKDSVASGKIMAASDGTLEFLGGQDMFEIFLPAAKAAKAQNLTQYDEVINALWLEEVREYTAGNKTREQAIADFRQQVADRFDIIVD
ncbi:MAG: extracellular solute-binding protein [Clostridia bacterium]|nr:extracellular solute-binding protein [Clostridia bacterium]